MVVPCVLGEDPKGISFTFMYEKEKRNLIIGIPKGNYVHQALLYHLKGYIVSLFP